MQERSQKLQRYFLKDINPVIRFLILSDTVIIGAAGLLGPIFALFVEDFITGGNAAVAGIAAGVYLFSRSILQIPIAHFLDKIRGEKDDFWLMVCFSILFALVPLFYLVIHTPLQLYIVQFVLGFFTAFTYPAFMAIFTRHIDGGKEGDRMGNLFHAYRCGERRLGYYWRVYGYFRGISHTNRCGGCGVFLGRFAFASH